MTRTRTISALAYLQSRPLTPFASVLLQIVVVCVSWSERRRTRIALADLDDHKLDDEGLTRGEALEEARRPFWQY